MAEESLADEPTAGWRLKLGIDYWYESLSTVSLINAAMMVLFGVMAISGNLRVHVMGATLIWAGYIVSLVLRTLDTAATQ